MRAFSGIFVTIFFLVEFLSPSRALLSKDVLRFLRADRDSFLRFSCENPEISRKLLGLAWSFEVEVSNGLEPFRELEDKLDLPLKFRMRKG